MEVPSRLPNDIEFSGERKRVRCNEGLGRGGNQSRLWCGRRMDRGFRVNAHVIRPRPRRDMHWKVCDERSARDAELDRSRAGKAAKRGLDHVPPVGEVRDLCSAVGSRVEDEGSNLRGFCRPWRDDDTDSG
jgi:hypothetical protein